MSDDPILLIENVRRSYRMGHSVIEVLKGVNFFLKRGQWCSVFGASGSGKTTLLNLIGLLERPDEGKIIIEGEDTSALSRRAAARFRGSRIGFVFQSYHLLPELTVLENVRFAGTVSGLSRSEAERRAAMLLERVGLKERITHRPGELSGGEQQRAAIARALVNDPPLLLADEPTGNLDPRTGEEILQLFQELRRETPERAILMITHNREIASLSDCTAELRDGLLVSGELFS